MAPVLGGSKPGVSGFQAAASLGVLALVLASAVACAASPDESGGTAVPALDQTPLPSASAAESSPASSAAAPLPAEPGAQSAPDPVLAAAKIRVETTLGGTVADGAKPATDRIRAALTGAGFTRDQTEVTAGRTPTGLDAEAVEAAVKMGDDCIVGQLRTGRVVVSVFPVLSDGRCLIGSPV